MTHLSLKTGSRSSHGFSGLKPIRTKLSSIIIATTSIAGSDNVTNNSFLLTIANFPELASWMVVYDEMRVIGGELSFHPFVGVNGTNPSLGAVSVMFDPTAGNPTSVTTTLEESYHSKIFANRSILDLPVVHTLSWKAPKCIPNSLVSNPGTTWFTLDNNSTPHMFSVHGFQTTLAGAGTVGLKFLATLNVEFRMRT
jgi:hypothetical protein